MNKALNKFVRDRHPEEAGKYKPEVITHGETKDDPALAALAPKVKQIFCEDAKKAIVTLKETAVGNEIKLFTITAHAMKSALANVGESEASQSAFALETAGKNGDTDFIGANTENFIRILEDLILKFTEITDNKDAPQDDVIEDALYLNEQLQIIKTACENYDDDKAYAALDRLKEKTWRKETSNMLEQIRDMLYVYSDFDGSAKRIDSFN